MQYFLHHVKDDMSVKYEEMKENIRKLQHQK